MTTFYGRPMASSAAARVGCATPRRQPRAADYSQRTHRNQVVGYSSRAHFQFGFSERSDDIADVFRGHGIGVRVLGAAHGVHPNAMRIVAPRTDERERFAGAVADLNR